MNPSRTCLPFLTLLLAFSGRLGADRSIYLHTLDVTHFVSGYGKTNQNPDKRPLQVGSQSFSQGIWTHAPSTAKLTLPPDALYLSATVGVQNQGNNLGTVRFIVRGEDNSILFDSGLMKADTPARDLEIPLAGRKAVFLVSDPGPDGNNNDHSVWGQARLIVEGKGLPPPAFVRNDTLTADVTSLQMPVDSPAEGLLVGNGRIGASLWGDLKYLILSLDLAGLWSPGTPLSAPPLSNLSPEGALKVLNQTAPGPRDLPRRLPLGRLVLRHKFGNTYTGVSLNHTTGLAQANFTGGIAPVTILAHPEEPVLLLSSGPNEIQPSLLPPVAAQTLGLSAPEQGSEDLPAGKLSWFTVNSSTGVTVAACLHHPKGEREPHTYLVTAETAATAAAARETAAARLTRLSAIDWKTQVKTAGDWWKKFNDSTRLAPGNADWKSRAGLARYLMAASRGSAEPGGWLWTFEETDPSRLPSALGTGYPANAQLFASARLGLSETASAQAAWHMARRDRYRAHGQNSFGTKLIVAPGLLRPDGSPAALAPEALAPSLSAQAAWPFLIAAQAAPDPAFARDTALPWLEETARALSSLASSTPGPPRLPWGAAPGRSPGSPPLAEHTWHDALLLRSSLTDLGYLAKQLEIKGVDTSWAETAGRIALPPTPAETAPGVSWNGPADRPGQLLGLHPLRLGSTSAPKLPAAQAANAPSSTLLWLACAAARSQPDEAAALAALPAGRNGLILAPTPEPGGPQGLAAQTLEFVANLFLRETPEGSAQVFPALPKDWPTASFKGLALSNGVRLGGEWADGSIREISLSSGRDAVAILVDSFGEKGFKSSHKAYRRASGSIIVTLKAGETAVLKAP